MNTNKLTFGDGDLFAVTVSDLSDAVKHTLMQRTFAHIMGNEAAAVRARLAAEKNADGTAKYNDAVLADKINDWRLDKIAAIENGEFSLRVVGPRLTADEKIAREFAKDALVNRMVAKKIPMPKATDKEAWDKLVDQYLAHPQGRKLADTEITRRKAAVTAEADFDPADLQQVG